MELVITLSAAFIERLFTQVIKPLLDPLFTRFSATDNTRARVTGVLTLLTGVLMAFAANFIPGLWGGTEFVDADPGFRVLVLGSVIAAAANGLHWTLSDGAERITNLFDALANWFNAKSPQLPTG